MATEKMFRFGVEGARLDPHSVSILGRRDVPVPFLEARNRGYSYPSGGRFRALRAILRPRIPRNRPPNAENRLESGPSGSTGLGAGADGRPGIRLRADTDRFAGCQRVPGWRVRRGSRWPDRQPRRRYARSGHRRLGPGGGAPRRLPRAAARKAGGLRGRQRPLPPSVFNTESADLAMGNLGWPFIDSIPVASEPQIPMRRLVVNVECPHMPFREGRT